MTPRLSSLASFLILACVALQSGILTAAEQELICRYHAHQTASDFGLELEGNGRRYAPDRFADILHLRLDVTPDFAKRTVSGTTRLEFKPLAQPLSQLTLNAVDLTIHAVRSDHEVLDFVNDGKQLVIQFREPIAAETMAYVEIDHSAQPTRGLYFRTPEMGYPAGDIHIWTQGESHEARFWFPCFDYPNERSSTEVICHVPPEMTVLSNGRKVSETIDERGLKRVQWLQEQPHVNYLICLVAGKFAKLEKMHRDIPLGFYVQPSLAEHAANSFEDTEKIMDFYEHEIGVPFPWEKYDQVTILDFVAGGMENTTLTTLTHNTIFTKEMENVRTTRRLDAHEMAHQWFGDYVTCKDWSHLWLNEGFATYYTHLYEGHKFGPDAMLYGLYRDAETRILTESKDVRAIVFRGYKNPAEQFDYRSYPKGSWVLHMLRSQLGPDLYRACIRHYLQQHALQSVVSEDLRQAVEALSGRPFDRFFDQWVYHAGHPELTVSYEWQSKSRLAKVTVKQTQATNDDVLLFQFPTTLRFLVDEKVIDHSIEVSQAEHEFYVPLPKQPSIVRFDPELTVLAKVTFKKPDDMLFAQLERTDDMLGRLLAAEALGERATLASVEHLEQTLRGDPFHGVRIEASKSLRKINTDESFAALRRCQDQADAQVRLQVVRDLATFYRPETQTDLVQILQQEANPEIKAEAIRALGRFHDANSQRLILEQLTSSSFRNELADAAVDAIAAQLAPKFRKPLRQQLESNAGQFSTRGLSDALLTLAKISRDMKNRTPVRLLIQQHLNDPRPAIRQGAIAALGQLGDPAAIGILEPLSGSEGNASIARSAKRALDRLQESSPLAPRELGEVRKALTSLREEKDALKKQVEALEDRLEAIQSSAAPLASTSRVTPAPEATAAVSDEPTQTESSAAKFPQESAAESIPK